MKFAIAYYLLLIYTTVILKPLIPVAEDALMHCFAEAYHIATVHAQYGNDHLEKNIATTNDDANSNSKNVLKEDNASSIHLSFIQEIYFAAIRVTKTFTVIQSISFLHKIFLSIVIPPPKFFL